MTESNTPINHATAARRVPAPEAPLRVAASDDEENQHELCDVTLAVSLPGTDAVVETRWRVRVGAERAGSITEWWTRRWLRVEVLAVERVAGPGEPAPRDG